MTVEFRVPLGQTRSVTLALHSLASAVRTSPGCLSCLVSLDLTDNGAVRYVEEWQREDDLRRRLGTDTFVQLISLMDGASQPPRIEFALASGTRGFDFVDEVRGTRMAD